MMRLIPELFVIVIDENVAFPKLSLAIPLPGSYSSDAGM